jgi:hypothetical protein
MIDLIIMYISEHLSCHHPVNIIYCYVNKRKLEIKNPPVFVPFFKTQQFMIYRIVALLLPFTVY